MIEEIKWTLNSLETSLRKIFKRWATVDRETKGSLTLVHAVLYWNKKKMAYRVKQVVVATDTGLLVTFSDLRPEREEQNSDTCQPHEDAPLKKWRKGEKGKKEAFCWSH